MLALSRKTGESIVVDGKITVTVVNVGRGRVKLAIQAPKEVSIYRSELLDQKPRQ